jgi:Flp pilus assembly protein TadD
MHRKENMLVIIFLASSVLLPYLSNGQGNPQSSKYIGIDKVKLADGSFIPTKRILHTEKIIMANPEYKKGNVISKELILFFAANHTDLDFNLPLNQNPVTRDKITEFTDFLKRGWKIKTIDIRAYTSPEGSTTANERLSAQRAEAARQYILGLHKNLADEDKSMSALRRNQDDLPFDLQAKGEDWDGLITSLEVFNIKEKNTIENIIRKQPDLNKREEEIRSMTAVYKELQEKVLPQLRRVSIIVTCYQPERTDQEIRHLATADPGKLSYKELMYAATIISDDSIKLSLFEYAAYHFADEWEAFNNTGCCYLTKDLTDKAVIYLNKALILFPDNGTILNNMGVAALRNQDTEKATTYFSKAAKEGIDVRYNTGIIALAREQYKEAIKLFDGVTCDYNAALAWLTMNDTDKAEDILSCACESAEKYYLKSVMAARKGNASALLENLGKACSGDSTYKEVAANDREFINFKQSPEFQKLIK